MRGLTLTERPLPACNSQLGETPRPSIHRAKVPGLLRRFPLLSSVRSAKYVLKITVNLLIARINYALYPCTRLQLVITSR